MKTDKCILRNKTKDKQRFKKYCYIFFNQYKARILKFEVDFPTPQNPSFGQVIVDKTD